MIQLHLPQIEQSERKLGQIFTFSVCVYGTERVRNTDQVLYGPFTTTYGYDALYQLTQAIYPAYDAALAIPWSDQTHAWTYGAIGNRLTQARTQNGGGTLDVATYTYNLSNHGPQLTGVTHTDGEPAVTLAYDDNGDTATRVENGVTTTYSWDMDDKMSGLTTSDNSQSATHVYAYNGDRLSRTLNNTTWIYLYSKEDILKVVQPGGSLTLTQGPGIDDVLAETVDGTTLYAYKNMLSSVTALFDSRASVANFYPYDAWGNTGTWPDPATDPNPYGYTGREWDTIGRHCYRNRLYSSDTQRFLSSDPAEKYRDYMYAFNDPVKYLDPFGLQAGISFKHHCHWRRTSPDSASFDCSKPEPVIWVGCTPPAKLLFWDSTSFNPYTNYAKWLKWRDHFGDLCMAEKGSAHCMMAGISYGGAGGMCSCCKDVCQKENP